MKKLNILLLLFACTLFANAQKALPGLGKTAGQEMVTKAIEKSLYIMKANYRLKDKNEDKFYGRDGNPDFGSGYGLAVKTEDGVLALSSQLMAWNYDNDYQEVSDKYDAVLSSIEISDLSELDFVPADKPAALDGPVQVIAPQTKGGLQIISQNGEINGWCVWLTTQAKDGIASAEDIKCQANTKVITIADSVKTIDAGNAPNGAKVIGGVYVCPVYEEGGVIRFCILGMLDNTFGKWSVIFPLTDFPTVKTDSKAKEDAPEKADKNINITPVDEDNADKKGKGKKKGK